MRPQITAVFVGPPASGKGTCSSILKEELGCTIIGPGDIYRKLREEDTELGRLVRSSLENGGYCPDSLTNRLMIEESQKTSKAVMDGYPRTISQLVCLLNSCEVAAFIHLDASFEELQRAALDRKICGNCKKVYSLHHAETWCKCPGSPIMETRFDDTAEIFPQRYQKYLDSTQPIIELIETLPNYRKFKVLFRPEGAMEVLDFVRQKANLT